MSELHLNSLEITNVRCFEHLTIEKLGRVNLIVGKNSVGKTALLEALWLYAANGSPFVINDILESRDENAYVKLNTKNYDSRDAAYFESLNYLFNKYTFRVGSGHRIGIGPVQISEAKLEIAIEMFAEQPYPGIPNSWITVGPLRQDEFNTLSNQHNRITIYKGDKILQSFTADLAKSSGGQIFLFWKFIPANGLDSKQMSDLWSSIILFDKRKTVIDALKNIVPTIEELDLIDVDSAPIFIAKLSNTRRIPVRSLGEGLLRTLGITLALNNAKGGGLLIDEFETGLHHGIQADLWRMIFLLANQLNVQVFATTHSWDCVEAFQEASAENKDEEAMLIRLQRKRDGTGIEVVSYDDRRRDIATRQGVEVR